MTTRAIWPGPALSASGLFFVLSLSACGGAPPEESSACATEDQAEGAVCVEAVEGTVVDEAGDPIPDLPVTVCGPICYRGTTNATGDFSIELNAELIPSEYSVQPHGTQLRSTYYYPLASDFSGGDYQAGTLRVVPLPGGGDIFVTKTDLESGETPPEQEIRSGDLSFHVLEGTLLRLDVADALAGDEGRKFRAAELTAEETLEFAPELEGARVFALGPFQADFQGPDDGAPQVSVSLVNALAWPAGSEVSVLALGTYLEPSWVTPSKFEEIGVATVTEDSASVELEAGDVEAGLHFITWLAFLPKN